MSSKDTLQTKLFAKTIISQRRKLENDYPYATGGRKKIICNKIKEINKILSRIGIEN